MDLLRLSFHVSPRGSILGSDHPRTLHEQARVLICQWGTEYRYRLDDICNSNAIVEATATTQTTKDWTHVCFRIRIFVSVLLEGLGDCADNRSVCVTSIIRLKSLYQISKAADTSLEGVNAAIWSGIEINVGIACSSLPTLKPLLVRVLPSLRSIVTSKERY